MTVSLVRRTSYDDIATEYDRRYVEDDYSGIAAALSTFLGSAKSQRVLEIGCGTGHWLQREAIECSMIGVDRSRAMLAVAHRAGVRVCEGEAERLPFRDEQFDRAFCINALHHFTDKRLVISETYRVLRQHGAFVSIGLDPHRGGDRWWVWDYFREAVENDRQRYPSTEQTIDRLNEAGFVACHHAEVQHLPADIEVAEALRTGALDKNQASSLAELSDAEYSAGLAKILAEKAKAEAQRESLRLYADLRVFATYGQKL